MNVVEVANTSIKKVSYSCVDETTTTICCIETITGFVIVGKSACVDPTAFDAVLGRMYAYEDAMRQLIEHVAFTLKVIEKNLSQLEGELIDEKLFAKINAIFNTGSTEFNIGKAWFSKE